MEDKIIENPGGFFEAQGCFHDTKVEQFRWLFKQKSLSLFINDLNSNFRGLPEYQGKMPVEIVLVGVNGFTAEISAEDEVLHIDEMSVTREPTGIGHTVSIRFWPDGHLGLRCDSVAIKRHASSQ